ncbi:MAG: NnrS family protein, partial [Alphaproteobacteria bacterium]
MFNWILIYPGLIFITPLFNDVFTWHGHEMVYGFTVAVLTGFLLTAVSTWTSTLPIKKNSLILLTIVWIMGRFVVTFPLLPQVISSIIDLTYLPLMIMIFSKPLLTAKNKRNYVIIAFLGQLFACNVFVHLAHYGLVSSSWGYNALYSSIGVILLF